MFDRRSIMKKISNLIKLDDFINKEYGNKGTVKRDKFEEGYHDFKLDVLVNDTRLRGDLHKFIPAKTSK